MWILLPSAVWSEIMSALCGASVLTMRCVCSGFRNLKARWTTVRCLNFSTALVNANLFMPTRVRTAELAATQSDLNNTIAFMRNLTELDATVLGYRLPLVRGFAHLRSLRIVFPNYILNPDSLPDFFTWVATSELEHFGLRCAAELDLGPLWANLLATKTDFISLDTGHTTVTPSMVRGLYAQVRLQSLTGEFHAELDLAGCATLRSAHFTLRTWSRPDFKAVPVTCLTLRGFLHQPITFPSTLKDLRCKMPLLLSSAERIRSDCLHLQRLEIVLDSTSFPPYGVFKCLFALPSLRVLTLTEQKRERRFCSEFDAWQNDHVSTPRVDAHIANRHHQHQQPHCDLAVFPSAVSGLNRVFLFGTANLRIFRGHELPLRDTGLRKRTRCLGSGPRRTDGGRTFFRPLSRSEKPLFLVRALLSASGYKRIRPRFEIEIEINSALGCFGTPISSCSCALSQLHAFFHTRIDRKAAKYCFFARPRRFRTAR